MKSVYIKDSLHRRAKSMAAAQGIPLNQFIERLLERALDQPEAARRPERFQVREPSSNYDTATAARQVGTGPDDSGEPDDLVARGLLISQEQVREWAHAMYLEMRAALGLEGPPPPEPPSIEEVREIFRRQRELHPDLPSTWEILRQMREEE